MYFPVLDDSYALKYFWETVNQRGETVRLEIHKKGYLGAPLIYKMCDVAGLRLQIQGEQGDPESPIVKTSLVIDLVDSYDAPAAEVGWIDGKYCYEKHGDWGEFYTPDSTQFLVKLYLTREGSRRLVWSGYITPDSWQESLDYRGIVTITARDNLGHLQDFDFDLSGDEYGLASVYEIIEGALTKIDFPMTVNNCFGSSSPRAALVAYGADVASGSRVLLPDLLVNVEALAGRTWWDALEGVLDSIGSVLRFRDYNMFNVVPLRYLPDLGIGRSVEPEPEDLEFYGGTRSLAPAFKEIVETMDYGQNDSLEYETEDTTKPTISLEANQSFVLEFHNDNTVDPNGGSASYSRVMTSTAPVARSVSGGGALGPFHLLRGELDPDKYEIQDDTLAAEGEAFRNYIFFSANRGTAATSGNTETITYLDNYPLFFYARIKSTAMKLTLNFASPAGFDANGKLGAYPFRLWKIRYQIAYRNTLADSGNTYYWTGTTWVSGVYTIEKEFDTDTEDVTSISENLKSYEARVGEYGYLWVSLVSVVYRSVTYTWRLDNAQRLVLYPDTSNGVYARLRSVTLENNQQKKMVSDTVTTVNNDAYNVRNTRTPLFGCLSTSVGFVVPANYLNAFFYYDSNGHPQAAPYKWQWTDRSTVLPFPVQMHMQLLQYHAVPLEILEGASGLEDKSAVLNLDGVLFSYKGISHFLLSGTWNMASGRFDTAIFRAFAQFSSEAVGDTSEESSTQTGVQTVALAESIAEEQLETEPTRTAATVTEGETVDLDDGTIDTIDRQFQDVIQEA